MRSTGAGMLLEILESRGLLAASVEFIDSLMHVDNDKVGTVDLTLDLSGSDADPSTAETVTITSSGVAEFPDAGSAFA